MQQDIEQLRETLTQRDQTSNATIVALKQRIEDLEKLAEQLTKSLQDIQEKDFISRPSLPALPLGSRSVVLLAAASSYNIVVSNDGQV